MSAIEKFTQFYQRLDAQSMQGLADIYAANVVFVDPVTKHEGLTALQHYFAKLLANTSACRFDIKQINQQGQHVFVSWQMHFSHPKLKAGKTISVEGVSELQIVNDKIVFHRDYYDMGEMIYQNIPILGYLIRLIKNRLAQ